MRPWFASGPLNAGFASELDALTARFEPLLWIRRHIHDLIDETLGAACVIATPLGYPGVEGCSFLCARSKLNSAL